MSLEAALETALQSAISVADDGDTVPEVAAVVQISLRAALAFVRAGKDPVVELERLVRSDPDVMAEWLRTLEGDAWHGVGRQTEPPPTPPTPKPRGDT